MSRLCRLKNDSHGPDGKWAHDEIKRLTKQRDDLLAALEGLLGLYRQREDAEVPEGYYQEEVTAMQAIASVKGETK